MKPRKVTYAKLQTEYFAVGTGNIGVTLGDPQKHRGMQMTFDGTVLEVSYKGVSFGIPAANIAGVTYAPEEQAKLEHKPTNA